jgi:integrase
VTIDLPRFVKPKPLKGGVVGYYWAVPTRYRKYGCTVDSEPLGSDYAKMVERAATLNGLVNEWNENRKGIEVLGERAPRVGTVDWLFQEYRRSKAYLEKVAKNSRSSYEKIMRMVTDTTTKTGERIGGKPIKSITPRAADKLYDKFTIGTKGQLRLRQAEKAVVLCRKAWRVVHRLYPEEFNTGKDEIPNPWPGVTMNSRIKATKPAVTRDQVYAFAWGCIEHGEVEVAAAAVICFEWLQRPENVIAGKLSWTDYRPAAAPTVVKILHHKTGRIVLHPLEEVTDSGVVYFYAEAEEVLAKLPRRGVPMILREIEPGKSKPFAQSSIQHIVQRMRKKLKLPAIFTLDACRHGGMTELEEAELTDGQGRALSGHATQQSYEGYAKRNMTRALSATRKRHAHRLANDASNEKATSVRNEQEKGVRNSAENKAG